MECQCLGLLSSEGFGRVVCLFVFLIVSELNFILKHLKSELSPDSVFLRVEPYVSAS